MRPLHLTLAAFAIILAACKGSVTVTGTGGGGSGGTGGGSGGAIGGSGGVGGIGGGTGGSCQRTTDAFSYTLRSKDPAQKPLDCGGMDPGGSATIHLEGVVTEHVVPDTYTIDTCPPTADCDISAVYDLTASAPGLSFYLQVGSFVQIDVQIDFPWGCSNVILVRNLPVWENAQSPSGPDPFLWLTGSEGSPQALPGAPFTLSTIPLGCHPGAEPGCGKEDEYTFDVVGDGFGGGAPVLVYQGESKVISASGQSPILFRNLRSFETGWCDDYWNWAYWATPAPIPD